MSEPELALLGGPPLRTRPFTGEPMIDDDEERMVLAALRTNSFSRYIGSTSPGIDETLRMTSAEAARIEDDWHFLGGTNVRAFAAEFAETLGVPYAIPVNAATTGLGVALAAAGVGPGDEVIVPAISFTATASAVLLFNSIPVFVDVDPRTFCMDPDAVRSAISPRTKAILPVHLTGNVAEMDALPAIANECDLVVIEDAAQAPGATWNGRMAGTLGDAGVFSFQQSKNVMTGEGGMIVTRDAEIARRCRLIANHGEVVFDEDCSPEELVNIVGGNFRLPELCAAIGRAQLRKLDAVNGWRKRNAEILRRDLEGLPGLDIPPAQQTADRRAVDVPHLFVALYEAAAMGMPREVFVAALRAEGVPVGTGYARPLYANPTFLNRIAYGSQGCPWSCRRDGAAAPEPRKYERGMCPVAERLLDDEFLWFYHIAYPSTEDDMHDVVRAVRKVVEGRERLAQVRLGDLGALAEKGQGRIGTGPPAAGRRNRA